MVRAAWKLVRMPTVKKRFKIRAQFATMPGMKPYIVIM